MQAKILDGKLLAQLLQIGIKHRVDERLKQGLRPPGLAVILVGDNPASHVYVANKSKAAKTCGFRVFDYVCPATSTSKELEKLIEQCNCNSEIDGVLLQLPLPQGLDQNYLIDLINPKKDADGLHTYNQGILMRGAAGPRPCTPAAVLALLDLAFSNLELKAGEEITLTPQDLSGKKALIIGRSILVGKPLGLMLLERNATVTYAHSKSPQLSELCRSSDIVIAAIGKLQLIQADWLNRQAVVIDVGINRLANGKLCGDVDFEQARHACAAITPVPGGVGPMTITMLLENTLQSSKDT